MRFHIVAPGDTLFKQYEDDIYRLRHKVFKEELNWKVNTIDGNKEIDCFDSLKGLHYVIAIDAEDKLIGCMRLLPTKSDYMLEKVFPILLDNKDIPKEDHVWEISRFVVDPQFKRKSKMLSFNKATLLLMKGMCEFSKEKGIHSYVTVTTDRMDRMLRKLKMDSKMIGKEIRYEDCNVLALQLNMNNHSFKAVEEALVN